MKLLAGLGLTPALVRASGGHLRRHPWQIGLTILGVALGVAVLSIEDIEAPEFHTFYGFVALIAVGIIYSYRQQIRQHVYLLYGLGGLFLMGLGIRAMILGET